MKVDLLYLLGIRNVEPIWWVRFETRRKREGEEIVPTKFRGVLEDKYVWEIAPMTIVDSNKIRFNRIYDEINDVHIPILEEDEISRKIKSVRSIYKREKTYRFGKQFSDDVIIQSKIKYHYEHSGHKV